MRAALCVCVRLCGCERALTCFCACVRRAFGEMHVDTVSTQHNLAELYIATNQTEKYDVCMCVHARVCALREHACVCVDCPCVCVL